MLLGHASYRNISMIIKDLLDYDISEGTINTIFKDAVGGARKINEVENLSKIDVSANDELFHKNKPILTGIDTRSLYCYLLASEDRRDEDTWAIHLWGANDKGLIPVRSIGDDAKGLVAGHKWVFPQAAYDYDNFHLSYSLKNLRRFFRNRLKRAIKALNTLESKTNPSVDNIKLAEQVVLAKKEKDKIDYVSTTLDTLIGWLEHDVLNKAGPTPTERSELYDFIVEEFQKLECIEADKIMAMRITLENKKEAVLNFVNVLDHQFQQLSQQFKISIDMLWDLCELQRCSVNNNQYYIRSMPIRIKLKDRFNEIEKAVVEVMDATERTSSMVENLNGRVRKYCRNRKIIGQDYLDLLRFVLNHKPIVRSARVERRGKTPAEILSGKPHPHWLELLGFERFKRAA
jgi:hypothetical protein